MTLRCAGVYNEQTLLEFFVEGIDLIIRSTMHRWADSREATLKYLAHQVQYLLELQGAQRKSATKEDAK